MKHCNTCQKRYGCSEQEEYDCKNRNYLYHTDDASHEKRRYNLMVTCPNCGKTSVYRVHFSPGWGGCSCSPINPESEYTPYLWTKEGSEVAELDINYCGCCHHFWR